MDTVAAATATTRIVDGRNERNSSVRRSARTPTARLGSDSRSRRSSFSTRPSRTRASIQERESGWGRTVVTRIGPSGRAIRRTARKTAPRAVLRAMTPKAAPGATFRDTGDWKRGSMVVPTADQQGPREPAPSPRNPLQERVSVAIDSRMRRCAIHGQKKVDKDLDSLYTQQHIV